MNATRPAPPAEPFFLPAKNGERFCLYHAPPPGVAASVALVYVHPFAEEMNRSRRIAALQARALAEAGVAVLQIDLLGCGDSSGDFGDADWRAWQCDLELACAWLSQRTEASVGLWGLRTGALLALALARSGIQPVARVLLWQPVTDGAAFVTQFLRLQLAGEMLRGAAARPASVADLRRRLDEGKHVEVAGYRLSPKLAQALDGCRLADLDWSCGPVDWFELQSDAGAPLPAGSTLAIDTWRRAGVDLRLHNVIGERFWAREETQPCTALLKATIAALAPPAHE